MAHAAPLTHDIDPAEPDVRSGFWRFAVPEYYTLALVISVGIATYVFVTGDAQSEQLLTPALVAAIMVANLVPAMALIVLIGSRVARARAVRSMEGGNGRLHVRLVALFSLIAAAPTLLVVIFASLLFQFGVDFWFSDRSRGMFENAANLAEGYYQENQTRCRATTRLRWPQIWATFSMLGRSTAIQLFKSIISSRSSFATSTNRRSSKSARDGVARTAAMIDPDDRAAENRLSPAMMQRLDAGEEVVVVREVEPD